MNKEPDWTLHNIGLMDETNLNDIVKQIEDGDERVLVEKSDIYVSVKAPNKRIVLTAAKIDLKIWHVRAVDGLLVAQEN